MHTFKRLLTTALLLVFYPLCAVAEQPAIAIIIDDLGNNLVTDRRVVNSNWPITCSILPARPYSKKLAELAHQQNKEVLVHIPMQSLKTKYFGHGELTENMSKQDFALSVNSSIDEIPYARGVNNHMGSLLTQHSEFMDLFMRTLANRDDYLYFIDSRTTASTVAAEIADEYHIPNLERDVFLDSVANDEEHIRNQFKRLVYIANNKGYALAIGHPNATTLSVLNQELVKLKEKNIRLVHVSELIEIARSKLWQISSSHSPKVAKN